MDETELQKQNRPRGKFALLREITHISTITYAIRFFY